MFGIGSKGGLERFAQDTTPAPNALKRALGGFLRRGATAASAQAKDAEPKPQKPEGKPARNAFEAGSLNSDKALRSLRTDTTQMHEGQVLRGLRDSLARIEAEIAQERARPSPDPDRQNGLKTLWAQDNDEMLALMKGIRDRESKGLGIRSEVSPPPQLRSLAEYNAAKGPAAVKPVDLDASAELKKMSELREKVEFSLASATDVHQQRNLAELMSDIDKRVHDLTQKAFGG